MRTISLRCVGCLICTLSLFIGVPRSQESSGRQSRTDPYHVGVEVDLISVPATARKLGEGYLHGLPKSAFHVFEDDVEQEITTFSQGDLPISVVLLLDISGSVQTFWAATRYATRQFVANLKPDDRVALVTFNTEVRLKMDWGEGARDIDSILNGLCCSGQTRLWDAVWLVCTELFRNVRGRKVLVILTDGLDNDSEIPFHQMLDAAVRSEATLFVVSKTQAIRKSSRKIHGASEADLLKADIDLRTLAYETGGRVLGQQLPGELENIYARIEEELRSQYVLGFTSSNRAKDGSYRKLRIEVDHPGAVITARPGYYAPSPNRAPVKH